MDRDAELVKAKRAIDNFRQEIREIDRVCNAPYTVYRKAKSRFLAVLLPCIAVILILVVVMLCNDFPVQIFRFCFYPILALIALILIACILFSLEVKAYGPYREKLKLRTSYQEGIRLQEERIRALDAETADNLNDRRK